MKQLWLVLGMLAFGVAAMAAFAILVAVRQGTPLRRAEAGGASPVARARAGVEASVRDALDSLAVRRQTEAARALDAAMRAAAVVEHALPEAHDAAFAEVQARVEQARRRLQNGERARAVAAVRQALDSVREEADADAVAEPPAAFGPYVGATVLDANGVRIGEVVAADDGAATLTLAIRGWRDLFCFLDLGGERVQVAAAELLYGERRAVGSTLVMWPGGPEGPAVSGR